MNDEHTLVQAAFKGDLKKVRRLLDAGVSVEATNEVWNALHAAIENEQFHCVRLLVERGANIEKENGGMTPLAHAVDVACDGSSQRGIAPGDAPTETVDYLLSVGAKPETALETARAYRSKKFLRLLQSERTKP